MPLHASAIALAWVVGLGIVLGVAGGGAAQDPVPPTPALPVPQSTNDTADQGAYSTVHIGLVTARTFAFLGENDAARFPVEIRDMSLEGTEYYVPAQPISCVTENVTQIERGWSFNYAAPGIIARGETVSFDVSVTTLTRPVPEQIEITIGCRAGGSLDRDIGNFTLTARAKPYHYVVLSPVGVLPPLEPDDEFEISVELQNSGNQFARFSGRVEAPQGWNFGGAPDVMLEPGERRIVNITGVAPREKMLYLSEAEGVRVAYWPADAPGRVQNAFIPLTVDGVYVHPAIVPLTLLALIILGTMIFMAVLAKRQIEEQILGKPVPPWRIPVERAYLEELEKTDPDEHYIVRHYLMEEEHASALLWYANFKKATKKDRIAETKWFKIKKKQERKIAKLEKEHVKLSKKWERKIKFLEWRRKRRLKKVDRKLKALNKGLQAKLDKAHKKEVAKLKKRFRKDKKKLKKRQKKAEKKTLRKHDRTVRKEERKLYRENRKRAKRGEDLLPPPEIPEPEMPKLQVEEPQYPERPVAQEMLLSETKFQKRADRINTRFDKKRARKEAKRDRILARHRARVDGKTQRLLAKVPPEPKTHLYDHDEYVPEDEVIVEDDRSALARWLNIPTLEERELARRRMEVHQAQRIRLKEAGDEEGLKRLDADWKEARKRLKAERKEHALAAHAAVKEEEAMARQRRKDARRRAKELTKEAKAEAKEMRVDQQVKAKPDRDSTKVPVKTPVPEAASSDPAGSEESRLKLRFGRRKAEKSEEGKTETTAAASDKRQE